MDIRDKIIEATVEIFTSMVMMDISVSEEQVENVGKISNSITGLIGLAGKYKGVLALHIPYNVACAITSNFLGLEIAEMNEDVDDAVGELANMLGGSVKTIISENGKDIELSIPSTISGEQYDFQPTKNSEKLIISFNTEVGGFFVELLMEH